jgi:urease subunit gamma/beta
LKLNAPEAIALICDAMLEVARAGATYQETEAAGRGAVAADDVMDGVAALVDEVRLEVLLDDGTRLIVLQHPLGEVSAFVSDRSAPPPAAPARETRTLTVTNSGQRPIRVSSHFPSTRSIRGSSSTAMRHAASAWTSPPAPRSVGRPAKPAT